MGFRVSEFAIPERWLYHLTAASNLDSIRSYSRLDSTSSLLTRAGRGDLLRTRRLNHFVVVVDGVEVILRDQYPLHPGMMTLAPHLGNDDDARLAGFVEVLNGRVFFWPGTVEGPSADGRRHFGRYEGEQPAVLRATAGGVNAANQPRLPEFSEYNSGAPGGRGNVCPRGRDTFAVGTKCNFRPGDVVEVTWPEFVALPPDTQVSLDGMVNWQPLFTRPPGG